MSSTEIGFLRVRLDKDTSRASGDFERVRASPPATGCKVLGNRRPSTASVVQRTIGHRCCPNAGKPLAMSARADEPHALTRGDRL